MTTQSGDVDTSAAGRKRKLMMVSREVGLSDEERYELASYLLRRDIRSWKGLTDSQVSRLLDAFEGFELIDQLIRQRA